MSLSGVLRNMIRRPSSGSQLLISRLPLSWRSNEMLLPLNPSPSISSSGCFSTATLGVALNSLTDTRFPKRRPGSNNRRKRATLKPPGPYTWVNYVPGEPLQNKPNEGSTTVKRSNRIKRIVQRKAFILSEKKKRKAQFQEFKKKRDMERIERKMAAVAREKAWAQRLIELQQLEAEKKAAAMGS